MCCCVFVCAGLSLRVCVCVGGRLFLSLYRRGYVCMRVPCIRVNRVCVCVSLRPSLRLFLLPFIGCNGYNINTHYARKTLSLFSLPPSLSLSLFPFGNMCVRKSSSTAVRARRNQNETPRAPA